MSEVSRSCRAFEVFSSNCVASLLSRENAGDMYAQIVSNGRLTPNEWSKSCRLGAISTPSSILPCYHRTRVHLLKVERYWALLFGAGAVE